MQADGQISAEIKRSRSRWRTRIESEWKLKGIHRNHTNIYKNDQIKRWTQWMKGGRGGERGG